MVIVILLVQPYNMEGMKVTDGINVNCLNCSGRRHSEGKKIKCLSKPVVSEIFTMILTCLESVTTRL